MCQWDFQGPLIMGPPYGKLPILFPYGSMGIVWEAYHKGVPLLGVPGITLDCGPNETCGPSANGRRDKPTAMIMFGKRC